VEAARDGINGVRYGAGRHSNIATASVLAVLSAARRLGVSARDLAVPLPMKVSGATTSR
jgi:2-isopropylmalate synthase